MFGKSHVAWKVSGLYSAIIVLVLAGTAYLNSLDDRRETLEAAKNVSIIHSMTVIHSLHRFMETGDSHGVLYLIQKIAQDNPVYDDIQLISHTGEIVSSINKQQANSIDQASWPCTECHLPNEETVLSEFETVDKIVESRDGGKNLSIFTPVQFSSSCKNSNCHVDAIEGRPLGFVRVDYSLKSVNELVARHSYKTFIAVVIAVLLCIAVSWFLVHHLIGKRFQILIEGLRRVAKEDFNFRFSTGGNDEFSELASAFNEMIAKLSKTLRELKRTREYLEGIVEESADIIITVDPEGLIKTFNTGAERILGYSREEVIGKRIEMLFAHPEERDVAIAQLEYTDHVVNYETHFLTKNGSIRNVILTLSKLRRGDGTPVGTYGISKDITREKRLQRQLLQSEKMAALGQAITGIQHSIKNLLNVLKGGSYMVKTGLSKGDKKLLDEGWEMVEEGIAHMTDMASQMLRYARERRVRTQSTNITEMVKKISNMSEAGFKEKGVHLEIDLEKGLPSIMCDVELIHSVIMDLLSNSLDACEWKDYGATEKARVKLSVHRKCPDHYICIEVTDNGEGMSEEVQAKIFTPFFSTKKKKGTGMGLAMVARSVSSHRGRITVESVVGKGTTFKVLLPVDGPRAREEEEYVEESLSS